MLTGFDLVRAAMAAPGVSANERSVLLVLAIMANDEAQAWPPVGGDTGLTAKCVLSERAVQRAVKELVALGHITRRQLRHGVVYTVHPAAELTPVTQTGVTQSPDTPTPVAQSVTPATQTPKLPVTTISSPETSSPTKARPGKRDLVEAGKPDGSDLPDLPDGATERQWIEFAAMRRRTRKPMTPYAAQRIRQKLRSMAEAGQPPGEVLDQSTMNNWQDIYPLREQRNGQRDHQGGWRNGAGGSAHPGGRIGAAADRVFGGMEG